MCSNARTISARYETRVGSPLDFQPKRVSAPSCFRALNRSAQAGRRARKWSKTQQITLQKRDDALANGAYDGNKPSKHETVLSRLEQ